MIPLDLRLDDIDYDGLLAIARSRLPALAPQWTDYNVHDPGIMLTELLAWFADTQVYSLARNRDDERRAMLRLLGRRARGALPARGMLVPAEPPLHARTIPRDTIVKPARGGAPRLETDAEITLLPLTIRSLITQGPAGPIDRAEANRTPRAAFDAFGPSGDGALAIELETLAAVLAEEKVRLSLGFRVENDAADMPARRYGRVGAFDTDGARLPRLRDTTLGLQRSGVMVFELDRAKLTQAIVLRPEAGYALRPRLIAVVVNALPVEQRATFPLDEWWGNGRPGQTLTIEPAGLFTGDETAEGRIWQCTDGARSAAVRTLTPEGWRAWRRGTLDQAEPGDEVFSLSEAADGSHLRVRFGNGINGQAPAVGERIELRLRLSCGQAGNVAPGAQWVLTQGGSRWRNPEPVGGGQIAESSRDALTRVRDALNARRPLATSGQLKAAADELSDALAIERIEVLDGWERGRKRPASPATRTVVAMHRETGAEDADWLAAIRRRLAGRVALGERLLVVPPVYRRFGLAVAASAVPGTLPRAVAEAVRTALTERFSAKHEPDWALGRDVSAAVVAGWVRRVAGVAAVTRVELVVAGRGQDRLAVGKGELPLLDGSVEVTIAEQPR